MSPGVSKWQTAWRRCTRLTCLASLSLSFSKNAGLRAVLQLRHACVLITASGS